MKKRRPPYSPSHLSRHSELVLQTVAEKQLVVHFFVAFSRFEFALKEAGYITGDQTQAKPDWQAFIDRFRGQFDPTAGPELAAALAFLAAEPPRRQILQGSSLAWAEARPPENGIDLPWVIRAVKTVRNNLFHGAKFGYLLEADHVERNESLLNAALEVLYSLLEYDQRVRHAFWGELFFEAAA